MGRTSGKSDEHFERLVTRPLINPSEKEADEAIGFVRERIGRTPVKTFKEDVLDRRDQLPSPGQVAQQLMGERRPLHTLRELQHQGSRDARFLKLLAPVIQLKRLTQRSIAVKTPPDCLL